MAITFEKLLKAIKEKLGADAADEIQKAIDDDKEAMRQRLATKSDDERIEQVIKDLAEIKTALAGLDIKGAVKAAFPEPVKGELVEIKQPTEWLDFMKNTTLAIATVQTAVNAMLEKMAQAPVQVEQKSADEGFLGVQSNKVTQELIAALTNANKKSDDAVNELFTHSAIRWNE